MKKSSPPPREERAGIIGRSKREVYRFSRRWVTLVPQRALKEGYGNDVCLGSDIRSESGAMRRNTSLGVLGLQKKREKMPLYIGVTFGLFTISHLATFLDLKEALESFLITIRASTYLIVIFTLYSRLKQARYLKSTKEA